MATSHRMNSRMGRRCPGNSFLGDPPSGLRTCAVAPITAIPAPPNSARIPMSGCRSQRFSRENRDSLRRVGGSGAWGRAVAVAPCVARRCGKALRCFRGSRFRQCLDHLGPGAPLARRQHAPDHLDPGFEFRVAHALDAAAMRHLKFARNQKTSNFKNAACCCFMTLRIAARPPSRKARCISAIVAAFNAFRAICSEKRE
jgi:hypothetical protein